MFARYQSQSQTLPQSGLFAGTILSGDDRITADAKGVVVEETHTFSASTVNQARFGWTHLDWKATPANAGTNINTELGIQGTPTQDGITGGLATISFSNGLTGFGGAGVEEDRNGVYQLGDTLSVVHGRHSLKFGYEYRRVSFLSEASSFAPNGEFDYDGRYTSGPNSVGEPFADFLLDTPYRARLSAVHTDDYQRRAQAGFAQDSFKVGPRLTVEVGIRYDFVTPVWEAQNHGAALDPYSHVLNIPGYKGILPDAVQSQIDAVILTVNTQASKYFGVKPDYHDFGPRFGFAWMLDPKTVLRSAYGLYYGPEQLGLFGEPSPGFSVPFLAEANYEAASSTARNSVNMATGFPASALTNPTTPTLFALDPGLRTPYFQQWNATLQHQFGESMLLEVAYIGSKTTADYTNLDWNIPALTTNPNASYVSRQPFPAVDANGNLVAGSQIQGTANDGMGKYDALGLKFERRLSRRVSFISAYTWSHAIDDSTNSGLSVGNNGRASYPSYEVKNQKSNSDTDLRHRWTNSFLLKAPSRPWSKFGGVASRVAGLIAGGWQLSGIFTVESGMWYTVNQIYDTGNIGGTAFCGNCRQRPDAVQGEDANGGPHEVNPNDISTHWFNVNAFQKAANGTVGNIGRNTVEGPGLVNIDASIGRQFALREKASLQIRLEAFNATNTTNFVVANGTTSPSGFSLGAANFGDLTGDRGGRVLQFVARLLF